MLRDGMMFRNSPAGAAAMAPQRSAFGLLSVAAAALLATLTAYFWMADLATDRVGTLHYPAESAGRTMERHLAFYNGIEALPALERTIYEALYGSAEDVANEAISTYREILRYLTEQGDQDTPWSVVNTRARLGILLAHTGRWQELADQFAIMQESPEEATIAAAIRFAYGLETTPAGPDVHTGLRLLPLGWAADEMSMRVGARTDNPWLYKRAHARAEYAGERQRSRTRWFALIVGGLMIGGFAAACILAFRAHRLPVWHAAALDAPWSTGAGLSVFVKAGALGMACFVVLGLTDSLFKPSVFSAWSTLFASLPLIWFIHYRLLRPRGMTWRDAFGLRLAPGGWLALLGVTLAVLAIERTGALLINWGAWELGFKTHWAEGMYERWIWGPWTTTMLSGVDAVVWAPVFEEIGFRGLVYITLRARFRALPAACLSAGLFAIMHVASLPVLLGVFWSGLVWALVFERFRSLLPAILAHATGNLLAVSSVLLFYR